MGINQLIGRGWPYSPPQAEKPGWTMYSAGALNDKNPWWPVMPDLSRYLQRLSYLLRQGRPVIDVAIYLPVEDFYGGMKPLSINPDLFEQIKELIGPKIIPDILDAGFNFDLIDDGTLIEAEAQRYKFIVLPGADIVPEKTQKWLRNFARNGGVVIAVDHKPKGDWPALEIVAEENLSHRIATGSQPDLQVELDSQSIGHVHRETTDADLYFVVNTGNAEREFRGRFRSKHRHAEMWDPMTGKSKQLASNNGEIQFRLEAYGSRVIVFRDSSAASLPEQERSSSSRDLSSSWTVTFGTGLRRIIDLPYSWTADTDTQYFSGTATFTKQVDLSDVDASAHLSLDFGQAVPAEKELLASNVWRGDSFAALVTSPVREAATIFVNGKRAGALWKPPFNIDLTGLMNVGENTLQIEVYNTAINEIVEAQKRRVAGVAAVTRRYGLRFRLQDFENLYPIPSGILSPVQLVVSK